MDIIYNSRYTNWEAMEEKSNFITFFTPTYNRASNLDKIYSMLLSQTNKSFVWIVVNDGSTDNTKCIVRKILDDELIPVCFISKDNGHKHSCFKAALSICRSQYFICMDDDDTYSPKSVDFFLKEWSIIHNEKRTDIGAIRTITKRGNGGYVSNVDIPDNELGKKCDMTSLERLFIYNIEQENWTCYDTTKLKEIDLFPENYWLKEKHRYFGESIWQGRFARKYKCRFINYSLREYCEDNISIMRNNSNQKFVDAFINTHMVLNEQYDYFIYNKCYLIKTIIWIGILRKRINISLQQQLKHCQNRSLKVLLCVLYPISKFAGVFYRLK